MVPDVNAVPSANEITVPRLRPSSAHVPPPSKIYSRRSPSRPRRRSIDGRPLVRSSTTKVSVRMKPRPAATAAAAATAIPAPTPATSTSTLPTSSSWRPPPPSRQVSWSYLRKTSWSSPHKHPLEAQPQDVDHGSSMGGTGDSGAGDPASSRAAGSLRPRYSVSYRLAKAPRAAATSAAAATVAPTAVGVDESPAAEPSPEASAGAEAGPTDATATKGSEETVTADDDDEGVTCAKNQSRSSTSPPPAQPTPLFDEATRLTAAWKDIQRKERQLKVREDALKLSQKRLRQDRDALEKEKRRVQEELKAQQEREREHEQQQKKTRTTTANATTAAPDEDTTRKRRAARRGRSRSRSKPRTKVVFPDDCWRLDHQKQQDHRHSSWSSVNSSDAGTNTSRHSSTSYPSDAESATTAATRTSSSSSTRPSPETQSDPNPQPQPQPKPTFEPKPKPTSAPIPITIPIPIPVPVPVPVPTPSPRRTWSPADLGPSLAAYNAQWTALSPRSAAIPYPSPNHSAAELVDATHLRSLLHLLLPLPAAAMEERRRILAAIIAGSGGGSTHHDAVVHYNVVHFFLVARGVACRPVLSRGFGTAAVVAPAVLKPDYRFGLRRVPVAAAVNGKEGSGGGREESKEHKQVSLRALVKEVRGELRRWHEDGLKYRGSGGGGDVENGHVEERKVNEELVKDETAKAVFRAFTELRDELLAEVRWRKSIGITDDGVVAAEPRREERPRSGYGAAPEEEQNGAGGVDWSVLSEAML
ncbi:uncharacterized protein BKCO1_8000218 [Diplodia corticola]|uniref:Uncharacterized protein n=1 Tax=Diplodia corticola TaxID=236234 RepID=A0A1J9S9I9_9PEZI|nr:uncharacterized protein BKCO1_8000218 [Diplodia corticola]OJD37159.1 hypothetical protein BKCO1_8000218 [Diplodia corticola]